MSDTILGGDFTVYYEADNRQKRIEWTGSATGTRTVNELYSALQDLFDELTQLDDGSPMSAQTPTEYTIGIIDTGDDDPWFIDDETVQHLTGGAIQTGSWTRVTSSNTGIVVITYTVGTDFISTDIGKTVSNATGGDSGTLLDFFDMGTTKYAIIRPDSSAAANDWDSVTGTITVTGGSAASVTQATAAVTGEKLWSNINTIGTIASNTHIYIRQNDWDFEGAGTKLLTGINSNAVAASDWWSDGQIDILVKVKDPISAAGDDLIDEGYITVLARQQSKTYSYFTTNLSNGGRTAIPLSTGTDLDNQYGYRQMALTGVTGTFAVGDVITDDSDSTIQGVVTDVNDLGGGSQTIQYYLIGDPLNDFSVATGALTGSPSTATASAVNPTNVNAAAAPATDITITFGANETYDIDENDTTENYSIVIDCSAETLDTMQQRLKYLTRRGETADLDAGAQTIEGQFYLGTDYILTYNTLTGTVSEGAVVTQLTSGATGTVTAHNTTDKILVLRESRGTFNTTNDVQVDGSNYVTMTGGTASVVTPNAAQPFGTYAGGTFFAARGVVLANVATADATNYQLTDDDGNVVNPPNKVSVTVGNTRSEDRIAVFRTSSGIINKTEYAAAGGEAAGAATIVTGSAIQTDVPGKTTGGTLIVVDDSADVEYPIRYSSWSGSTFTLANLTGTATAGTSDTALVDTGEAFLTTVRVGDIVYVAGKGYSYVTAVTDNENLVLAGGTLSGFVSTDPYEINAVPVAITASDFIYVPIMWVYESTGTDGTPGSESVTVTYTSDIAVLVVARNSNNTASATTPMLPYSASANVLSTGLTNNIIRSVDSIKT